MKIFFTTPHRWGEWQFVWSPKMAAATASLSCHRLAPPIPILNPQRILKTLSSSPPMITRRNLRRHVRVSVAENEQKPSAVECVGTGTDVECSISSPPPEMEDRPRRSGGFGFSAEEAWVWAVVSASFNICHMDTLIFCWTLTRHSASCFQGFLALGLQKTSAGLGSVSNALKILVSSLLITERHNNWGSY